MGWRMFTLQCNGQEVQLDQAGFLIDENDWNEDVAAALASKDGIDSLSAEQLTIIRFLRECFLQHSVFPILNAVCRITSQPEQCVHEQFIYPEQAWRIGGLSQQNGVRFLSQCGKNSPAVPPASREGDHPSNHA